MGYTREEKVSYFLFSEKLEVFKFQPRSMFSSLETEITKTRLTFDTLQTEAIETFVKEGQQGFFLLLQFCNHSSNDDFT